MQSPTSINQTTTTTTSPAIAVKSSQYQETILHSNISGLETGRCRYVTLWHGWSEIGTDNPLLVALVLPRLLNLLQYAGTSSAGVSGTKCSQLALRSQSPADNNKDSGDRDISMDISSSSSASTSMATAAHSTNNNFRWD